MGNVPPRKTSRRQLGDSGEDIACRYYADCGYVILARNVHISRVGEIDIIASRRIVEKSELVFIEVKTRSSSFAGEGYEAISYAKRVRMRNCAMAWIGNNVDRSKQKISWRLDVVSINMSSTEPLITVFENIEV